MSFRQLGQHHASAEITLMEWNPVKDVIALATVTGEVLLHSLTWQKIWSIPSTSTNGKAVLVTALAWRPDGNILAYAYDNGFITLCNLAKSEATHLLDVFCLPTSLNWVQCSKKDGFKFYKDRSKEFLHEHYEFNKDIEAQSEVAEDFKMMEDQNDLNILAIGMETGRIHLRSFGMFPSGYINVNLQPDNPVRNKIISVAMSRDLRLLTVVLERREGDNNIYYFQSCSVSLYCDYLEEFKAVSIKYSQITSLIAYLARVLASIAESWKAILLEIGTKLHNYASRKDRVSESSISDDLLELLMFGNPSDSLEKFLLHDLTGKGLKKLANSIELSYSNIQQIVLKRLQSVTWSLFYQLNEVKGMAMWSERFGAVGLDESTANEAVLIVGSFLLKAGEIQQVIDNSRQNFGAFFRWLYAVILELSNEPIPVEISKVSEKDLRFVSEFLQENFAIELDENRRTMVKVERMDQYLKYEDLPHPASTSGNVFVKFINDHPVLKEKGMVFPHFPQKSIVTLFDDLRNVIDTALKGPWAEVLENTIKRRSLYFLSLEFLDKTRSPPKVSHACCPETGFMYTVVTNQSPPCAHFYLIREKSLEGPLEAIGLTFRDLQTLPSSSSVSSDKNGTHTILDLQFYSHETLTVLLQEDFESENNFPVLLQLSIKPICSKLKRVEQVPGRCLGLDVPVLDALPFIERNHYKRLENVKASQIAVSGSRKVACVLFASKRQVRIYEMEEDD